MEEYYFTAVYRMGVPLYVRHLTYDEAQRMFNENVNSNPLVAYCQWGLADDMLNSYRAE